MQIPQAVVLNFLALKICSKIVQDGQSRNEGVQLGDKPEKEANIEHFHAKSPLIFTSGLRNRNFYLIFSVPL